MNAMNRPMFRKISAITFCLIASLAWGQDEAKPAPQPVLEVNDADQVLRIANAPIRTVVDVLADNAKLNIIVPGELQGNITISLRGVDSETALRLVLESAGFAMVKEGNVVKVKKLVVKKTSEEPLELAVIRLRYARANEVVNALGPLVSPLGKVSTLAATTGTVQGAARTAVQAAKGTDPFQNQMSSQTVVIADIAAWMPKLKAVVEELDTPPQQVVIHAKLWEVVKNPSEVKGIDWSQTFGGYQLGLSAGQQPTPTDLTANTTVDARTLSTTFALSNFHWIGTAVMNAQQVRATVGYLYQDSDAELVGSPHVAVEDGKLARLNVTTQVPIPQFTFNSTTASLELSGFEYKDIGVTLNVTPRISPNESVSMLVSPEVSNLNTQADFAKFGVVTGSSTSTTVPVIDVRNATTQVTVKSGETLAIGGLMRDDITKKYTKVPVLGNIPLLRHAFSSRNLVRTKRNLLIFVTPTILVPGQGTGFESEFKEFPTGHQDVFADDNSKQNAKPKTLPARPRTVKTTKDYPSK